MVAKKLGTRTLGKVVKSNSHCDYVVQLDDDMSTSCPPQPGEFGFGSFVKLANGDRPSIVGIIYNSQLVNPTFLNNGPRLSSEPDPVFAPDLIHETRTLLGIVLIGILEADPSQTEIYGVQSIPRDVVPVNAAVECMDDHEIYRFHLNAEGKPQFRYYSLLLRYGGSFAAHLTEQVLQELIDFNLFPPQDQRALEMLCKELTWRNTMGTLR
ncbi:MAG: hypothetical protein HC771_14275 [Synechococcales cyanobacterium CRU_2_2]|nr:hypothetical protein [Synechococcales cyanobacterium CRU_2_2]